MIQQIMQLTDDLDGTLDAEDNPVKTSTFAWRGTTYEIDLTDSHEEDLHAALLPFLEVARTVGRYARPAAKPSTTTTRTGPDPKAVRAWATAGGMDVPARGRLPQAIIDAYIESHA